MKRTTIVIALALASVMAVSCAKNESEKKNVDQTVLNQQAPGAMEQEICWCHLDERSIDATKGQIMDMLWTFHESTVLLIREPGNPDIGIIRCDNPAAKPLWDKIQQLIAGAKVSSIITADKGERDQWADNMENDGYHVVIWMDENGFYYGLAFDDEEWCALTGLGCPED